MTEIALVSKVANFLTEKGYSVGLEIPTMGQSADIVAERSEQLTFVEAKIYNWKRALLQCKNHQIVADYIYIAIGTKSVSQDFYDAAREKGVGIIQYNHESDSCNVYLEAAANDNIWLPQQNVLKRKFEKLKHYGHTTLDDIRHIC